MAGTNLSGSSLWEVANVKQFENAVKSVSSALGDMASAFGTMADKANKSIKTVRDNLAGLKKDVASLGSSSGGLVPTGSRRGSGGTNGGRAGSKWGDPYSAPTADATAALTDAPRVGGGSNGAGGWGSSNGLGGMYGPGFSSKRMVLGAAAYGAGKVAQVAGNAAVNQGLSQQQLGAMVASSRGQTLSGKNIASGYKWAENAFGTGWITPGQSTAQNVAQLGAATQQLGARGYAVGTPQAQQWAGQVGLLGTTANTFGVQGFGVGQAAQFMNTFNSAAGLQNRMKAAVGYNDNLMQAVMQIVDPTGKATSKQVAAEMTRGTPQMSRLSALTGGDQSATQTLAYLAQQVAGHPGAAQQLMSAKTPAEFTKLQNQLGMGGTDVATLQKAGATTAKATASMADTATRAYAETKKIEANTLNTVTGIAGLKQVLDVIAGIGGAGGAVGGGALGAVGFEAAKIGGKALKSRIGGKGAGSTGEVSTAGEVAGGAATSGEVATGIGAGTIAAGAGVAAGAAGALFATGWGLASGADPNLIGTGAAKADSFGLPQNGLHISQKAQENLKGLGALKGLDLSKLGTALQTQPVGGIRGQGAVGQAGSTQAGMPTTAPASGGSSRVVGIAEKYLGTPYLWGGTTPKGFDCFVAGTLVTTHRGDVPIEDVGEGDFVLTRYGFRSVVACWLANPSASVVTLELSSGKKLSGTPDHRIWTENRGWVALQDIQEFDALVSCSPNGVVTAVQIIEQQDEQPVYDIWVEEDHEFFANGVLVHNCSGFAQYVYKQVGIDLPRLTYDQVKTGTAVPSLAQSQPGDLLFFEPGPSGPGHVGIYLGGNKMIDAPHTGANVRIESVWPGVVAIRREMAGNGNAAKSSTVGSVPTASTATATGTFSAPSMGMLAGVGEGNAGETEAATIASSMFATFASALMGKGTAANGGAQGNTSSNGGSSAAGAAGAPGTSGPVSGTGAVPGVTYHPGGATYGNKPANPAGFAPTPMNSTARLVQQMAAKRGWTGNEWVALNDVEMHEAGWNINAGNSSGAYGLAQLIGGPAEYAQYGGDAKTASGQGTAFLNYIAQRYGDPIKAWQHEVNVGWYDKGSQYIDRDQLAMLHRGEMVVRAADASTRRMMQNSSSNGPMINVEKGAVVFNLTPSIGMGSGSTSAVPAQQDMESAADVFWAQIEKKASMSRLAAE